jgi:exonuclease SbcC
MIISEAKKILEKHLGRQSVKFVDERNGIFRCTKDFEQRPYQVMYVDCSNIWLSKDFEAKQLEDYQSKTLLKDYYGKPGPLQWNYYYAFISKPEDIRGKEKQKKDIESNELYTRKLVLTPQELDEWLARLKQLSRPSETLIEADLASTWIKKLQEKKLDAIFLPSPVTAGVRHYMDNKPIIRTSEKQIHDGRENGGGEKISIIEYLKLNKYRPHPERREFDFGRVNLIKGVNGTGKTSLLESIELLFCGITFRNPEEDTSGYDFFARIRGRKTPLKFISDNLKLYKDRDKNWYNNAEQKFNRLPVSFNKYNFYNADTAFHLSNNPDRSDIIKAFEDIALGQDVNRIEDRLKGFKELFNKEFRLFDKAHKETMQEKLKEEKLLKEISGKDKDPERFFNELLKEIKTAKWLTQTDIPTDKLVAVLEKDLVISKTYLQVVQTNIKWSESSTLADVERQLKEYSTFNSVITRLDNEIIAIEKLQAQNSSKIDELKDVNNLIKQLSLYYKNTRIAELHGLNGKIKESGSVIAGLKKAKRIYDELDSESLEEIPIGSKLNVYDKLLANDIKKKEADIKRLYDQQTKLTTGFSQLDQVIGEIKARGKEFLQLNPKATECPLCHSPNSYEQLVRLITKSRSNIQSSNVVSELVTQVRTEKNLLSSLERRKKAIDRIKQLTSLLLNEKEHSRAIKSILKSIEDLIDSLPEKEQEDHRFEELLTYFEKYDLHEDTFSKLLEEAISFNLEFKDAEDFKSKEAKIKGDLHSLQEKAKKLKDQVDELNEKKADQLSKTGISKRSADDIPDRLRKLKSAMDNLLSLKNLIVFGDQEKFDVLATAMEKIQQLLNKYKIVQKEKRDHESRLKSTDQRITDLRKKEKNNKVLADRASKACQDIDEILTKSSKSDYLKKFIDWNKSEIVEIFKMIHSPKEFDDLNFGAKGKLSLRRKHAGKNAPITQISTGQRSALSLSIFSALNRKLKNGPDVLIFDDPAINVDDLNILSYLDYLREVALNGNRQVFFATANDNLAFLFTQKFKFLDKEFVTIELTR